MTAFALITSLLNTLHFHFQQPVPCLILDDTEMVESLCKKIRFLQAFLEDSHINSEARSGLETEIRGVAHDAEAKIESELHLLYLQCNQEEVDHPVKPPQSLYHTLQQVTREIESIEERIRIESNNNQSVEVEPQRRNRTENNSFYGLSSEPKNVMVGCDDEFETIGHKLISHSKKLEVISIVGMGGIGKTTLVQRVYENTSIISHFDVRAWTTVSQEYNLEEMLLDLLGCIGKRSSVGSTIEGDTSNDDPPAIDLTDLPAININERPISNDPPATRLRKALMGKRYLIVIDDIWSTKAWDDIHTCFPKEDFNGSRILLTTRLKQVADYASVSNNSHYMRFLNFNESWNLFYKKVFEEKKFPAQFKRICRGIVEKCQGLPLTIIVVAGLITSINKESLNQWGIVTENLNSLLSMDPEERCSKILSLSYYHLPPHLKVCFLYFGVFPGDSKILVKRLVQLWVAEGFLKLDLNKSMEEVAEAYLQDLIDRGLVQIDKQSPNGKIKSCRLHDLLHSFCLIEAQRENLLCFINENNIDVAMSTSFNPKACRWICSQLSHLHLSIVRAWYDDTHTSDEEIHSFIYFLKDFPRSYEPWSSSFKLLKVLDIGSTLILDIIPGEIVDLVNLRYLALSTSVVLHKFQWFKLRSLQTFIVDFHGNSWKAEPPHILDMPRLRNVYFTKGSPLYLPKLVQENLLTISWLNVPEPLWTKSDLTKIPNVKKLGIYIGTSMNFMPSLLPPGSLDGLADLHQLENLKIAAKESNLLVGDFQLPKVFPPNLKKLTLCHTYLPWDDMLLIATLPNLEILKLIGYAFYGSEWKTTENGFCRLKYFQIEESNLKYWSAVANHFPALEYLILSYCQHLEEVPADFVDITTLQVIKLTHCCSSLVTSAKHIQKERLDYGDYKLVVRDFHTLPQRKQLFPERLLGGY